MGINIHTLTLLEQLTKTIDMAAANLALIGDLYMRYPVSNLRANQFFRNKGKWGAVLSFDINRKADVTCDLGEPLPPIYHNFFDGLVNGGTAEHVANQTVFFENCHNIIKPKGFLLHVFPEKGSFPGHAQHYYDLDFIETYANTYNYGIYAIYRVKHRQGWAIYAAFKKYA